jgi:hypothetical protein
VKKCPLCVVVVSDLAEKCPGCYGKLIDMKPPRKFRRKPSRWLLLTVVGFLMWAWAIWQRTVHA